MKPSEYLKKVRIEEELDKNVLKHMELTIKHNGKKCNICGVIQGKSNKGFKRFYCEHLTKKIDKKIKKQNERVCLKVMDLMC
jgi:hypothetical protein